MTRHGIGDTLPIPLHEHRNTCHHRTYNLSCVQYDDLQWQAAWRCQICGVRAEAVQKRPLYIDHDNRLGNGWNHVRGLVCSKCNSGLRYVDNGHRRPSPEQKRYLDRAWFWQGLRSDLIEQPWLPATCANPNHALSPLSPRP